MKHAGIAISILFCLIIGSGVMLVWQMNMSFHDSHVVLLHLIGDLLLLSMVGWLLYTMNQRDRQSTETILTKELRFRAFINAMPDYICVKDDQGRVLEMNDVARSLFLIENGKDLAAAEQNETFTRSFCGCGKSDEIVWQTGTPLRHEETFPMPDGTFRHFDVLKVPVFDTSQKRRVILVIGRDVTSKKQAESELIRTKEQLESFLQQSPDAISVIDLDGKVLSCNQASERIFGYTVEEVLGGMIPGIPAHLQAEADDVHRQVVNGKHISGLEVIRYRKDGSPINISLSLSPIVDAHEKVVAIAGSARDITEKKHVEKLLRESEAKYRLIAENMTDLISIINAEGTVTYASPSHQMILGYSQDVYYGEGRHQLVHPDDLEQVWQGIRRMKQTKSLTTLEYRFLHHDGHWIHLESRYKPVLDEEGEILNFLVVTRDITEQKRTEELLRQSDKLSAIGQLAAGIAHEIRNPLTALRGFIQLLESSVSDEKKYCEIMLAELDRINFIVSELLLLAKPQAIRFQIKDVHELLQNVLSLLDTQAILNNIQIHTRFADNLPQISCEENQIKQVFINIFKNAIEAMPHGGMITVEGSVREDGSVLIRISDSGCGIDPDRIPKLGEPFYTTKEKGTGLGLMVSYKIIENHGGSILVSSELNKGTTVDVVLPSAVGF
ncbi:PAS domain S-box protein [Brevibacillus sp. H7]|uniref:PAS domain S-box protein n=1 Tax=Brevibacillus sp. H7 TaxID=3349138 RepID=UPI0037F60E81